MKIKTKKQMNLPQLIEWGFENNVRNECFLTHDSEGNTSEVHFDIRGLPKFSSMVDKNDTFTVKVEEEITEDTKFNNLIYIADDNDIEVISNFTIREVKDSNIKELHAYIDRELKCIWRDGKLVK